MLCSLCLHVAHDFAPLTEIQLSPIAHIHLQNVSLRQFNLGLCKKIQVLRLNEWSNRRTLSFNRPCYWFPFLSKFCLSFSLLHPKLSNDLLFTHRQIILALSSHHISFRHKFSELPLLDLLDILVLQVHPKQRPKSLPLIDNGQEPGHRQLDLLQVILPKENLPELLRHQEVWLDLILLF